MTGFVPFASRMMSSWQVASLIMWLRPSLACQADCAWIADDDDESPPETPGLRDQSTGTAWEAPEIDFKDGRKSALHHL
jgi:hypothetical protein